MGGGGSDIADHLRLLVRTKEDSYLANAVDLENKQALPEARFDAAFLPGGDCFAQVEETPDARVVLRNSITAEIETELLIHGGDLKGTEMKSEYKVAHLAYSPRGTFVQTYARRGADDGKEGNLVVWDAKTGKKLIHFHQKTFLIDRWPYVQWSDDEKVAVRAVTNEVHVYNGQDISAGITSKVRIPSVAKIMLSRGGAPYRVAGFIPESGGSPGKTVMYHLTTGEQISSRSMFRADNASFLWHPKGTSLLTWAVSDTDASGKSYYGESNLFFMDALGKQSDRVDLDKEGGTHDVAWSPNGQGFVVIYGYMPAQATLFNQKCEPIFKFGTSARNTVCFSPHGRFLALGGFGNLAGFVEFWDKNKRSLLGTVEMPCTTSHCWSPCSRYFLSATTFPRLRVDNCFRLYKYNGVHLFTVAVPDRLHQVALQCLPESRFEDRAASLERGDGSSAGTGAVTAAKPVVEKKAYRPPGARGGVGGASFSLHEHSSSGVVDKKTAPVISGRRKAVVPGAEVTNEVLSKSQMKNIRKKEAAQRKKDLAEGPGGDGRTASTGGALDAVEMTTDAAEKRLKALSKKLKQIEGLKADLESGKDLAPEQKLKVDNEGCVKQEIEEVRKRLENLAQ